MCSCGNKHSKKATMDKLPLLEPKLTFSVTVGFLLLALFTDLSDSLGTCKAGELRCQSSGHCVPKSKVCDGFRDCPDNLDEHDLICASSKFRRGLCGAGPKKVGVFQCQYSGCIFVSRVCDGNVNCIDGSDETEHICGGNSCLPGQFRCKYGACIADYRMCNGIINCPDGSDETLEVCRKVKCKENEFRCKYGACIPKNRICDSRKHCYDGSDESSELCLITRAKMLIRWKKEDKLEEERERLAEKLAEEVKQRLTAQNNTVSVLATSASAVPEVSIPSPKRFNRGPSPELVAVANLLRKAESISTATLRTTAKTTTSTTIQPIPTSTISTSTTPKTTTSTTAKTTTSTTPKTTTSTTPKTTTSAAPKTTRSTTPKTTTTTTPSTDELVTDSTETSEIENFSTIIPDETDFNTNTEIVESDSSFTTIVTEINSNTTIPETIPITPAVERPVFNSSTTSTLISRTTSLTTVSSTTTISPSTYKSSAPTTPTIQEIKNVDLAVVTNSLNEPQFLECVLPEIPDNSEATIVSCRSNPDAYHCNQNSSTVPYGVVVQFQCNPGFVMDGALYITCQKTGNWSSPAPTCEPFVDVRFGLGSLIPNDFRIRCRGLTPTRGVKVECINPKNLEIKSCSEQQKAGVEARFTCLPYYRPSGDLPVHYEKCGEDGLWTPGVHTQFTCVQDCGISEAPKTPFITNGQGTKRGQWPWHVGIYVMVKQKLEYICGGALITEQSVLTSAHCVTIRGIARNASEFVLFLGKQHIVLPETDPFVQRRLVTKVLVEDSFNYLALDSDIAILALETPAVSTFYVRPVCYPQASNSFLEEYQLAQGNMGTVLGWGVTTNGSLASNLQMTELPVVSTAVCAESHRDFFAAMTRSTTFCAGYRNGTNVCNGDSGGGMYFRAINRGSSRWYIQGLVSYGVPDEGKKKCTSLHYAVFTRVGRYGDWIVRTLSRENLI